MAIALVRENGEWKILSLHKPEAGLLADDPRPQPNPIDQTRLVRETTGKFANAVASHDFTQFHQSAAALWQRQITPQKLAEAFGSFSAAGVDLRGLGAVEPRISSAAFDDDGTFAIAGTYLMSGNTFEYRYRYIFEGTDWKMVGVSAHLR
jgi:hypothetical protein